MIPKKVEARLSAALKRFQPILSSARARDINEADTVTIVKDLLAELFGYDKYSEVTSEFAIRGTYCDLGIKIDGVLELLIEVKAIGIDLKDQHVKQAVDYAANQGAEWVVLTNGVEWRVYRVVFAKPIEQEMVLEMSLLDLNSRVVAHLAAPYLLTREAITKASLSEFHTQRQATSKWLLSAIVLSDPVLEIVRRELRRINPDVRIELPDLREALAGEVLKREVVEGEKFVEAKKKVAKAANKALRARTAKASGSVEQAVDDVLEGAAVTLGEDSAGPDIVEDGQASRTSEPEVPISESGEEAAT